ncbi:MAG: tRNA uridine-5-carboxymethylaminomethyl(34) synthesis GTPase MnmE [Salibacteraceae bacterium]
MIENDTIVALSTPQGEGALGIIRLSGPESLAIAAKHLVAKPPFEARYANFDRFVIDGDVLDEVVWTWFKAPASYTGENIVEIAFHGSRYIVSQALNALCQSGARLAKPGEFTQRAFLNGKLDLSQAEAVADLIAAESEAEHRLAINQMRGGFSREINKLRQQLMDFVSLLELELDFGEEDVTFANRDQLMNLVDQSLNFIKSLISTFRYGNAIKGGIPVAILGAPNAGKSTLLNALVNDERAIVSEIAGTTRDTIEDETIIKGIRFRFIDTAGLRDTADVIEAEGVKRSLALVQKASIVLYLIDISAPPDEELNRVNDIRNGLEGHQTLLLVANKADLNDNSAEWADITISAKHGKNMDALCEKLAKAVEQLKANSADIAVTNARHHQALTLAAAALEQARLDIEQNLPGELASSDVREAIHHLGSITGEITPDDILGNIFGKFCIGK